MNTACSYAIVRFEPYIETGEFANVGVVLIDSKNGGLFFRLQNRRYGRVTSFFDDLDKKTYTYTIRNIETELTRIRELASSKGEGVLTSLFHELIRPRETMVKFSAPRVVMSKNPEETLNKLFDYYVERTFVDRDLKEALMVRSVREFLRGARLDKNFSLRSIGDEFYESTFPFVMQGDRNVPKVIKPLHLAGKKPSQLIDIAGKWLFKVDELRERGFLGEDVLFTFDEPRKHTKAHDAYLHILDKFKQYNVQNTLNEDKETILKFARD